MKPADFPQLVLDTAARCERRERRTNLALRARVDAVFAQTSQLELESALDAALPETLCACGEAGTHQQRDSYDNGLLDLWRCVGCCRGECDERGCQS